MLVKSFPETSGKELTLLVIFYWSPCVNYLIIIRRIFTLGLQIDVVMNWIIREAPSLISLNLTIFHGFLYKEFSSLYFLNHAYNFIALLLLWSRPWLLIFYFLNKIKSSHYFSFGILTWQMIGICLFIHSFLYVSAALYRPQYLHFSIYIYGILF